MNVVADVPMADAANPIKSAAGTRQDGRRRDGQAHGEQHDGEADGVERAAHQSPGHLADRDIGHPERRGEDGVVRLGVLQLEEHVERALVDGAVHRRRREQRRRHERRVGDALHVADEPAQPEADADQVEERLEEAGEDDQPPAPVDPQVALDQPAGAAAAHGHHGEDAGQRRQGYFTSFRRKVTNEATVPAAMNTPSTARWTIASTGSTVPSDVPRVRATPWKSGVR